MFQMKILMHEMLPSPPANSAKNRALDGLPKSFIHILRTLFDILDNKQTGLVKFSGIVFVEGVC